MQTTIDKAGRLVIPKVLRERVGMEPGAVEITIDGAGLHIEPVATGRLIEEDGFLVIAPTGNALTDEMIRELRFADQR